MSLSRRKFVHNGISALFPHTGFQHRLMTPTLRYRKPFSQIVKKAATPPSINVMRNVQITLQNIHHFYPPLLNKGLQAKRLIGMPLGALISVRSNRD